MALHNFSSYSSTPYSSSKHFICQQRSDLGSTEFHSSFYRERPVFPNIHMRQQSEFKLDSCSLLPEKTNGTNDQVCKRTQYLSDAKMEQNFQPSLS